MEILYTVHEFPVEFNDSPMIHMDEKPMALLPGALLPIRYLNPQDEKFTKNFAYLNPHDEYFYLYKGATMGAEAIKDQMEPGIYFDSKIKKYILIAHRPELPESEAYKVGPNTIARCNAKSIAEDLRENEADMKKAQAVSSKIYIPQMTTDDDILKRVIKAAIEQKQIDMSGTASVVGIHHIPGQPMFESRNQLFNTLQVLKGESRMSIGIFQRCLNALGLKCIITVEDASDNESKIVGKPLSEPITASTEDTFSM